MKKILIDYDGGSHGHFLEFVLNSLDSPTNELLFSSPFNLNDRGTSRQRLYKPWSLRFCADHYSEQYKILERSNDIKEASDCIFIRVNHTVSQVIVALKVTLARADPVVDLSDFENLNTNFFNKIKGSLISSRILPWFDQQHINLSNTSPDLKYYQLRHFFVNHSFNKNNLRYNALPFIKDKTVTDVWFDDFYSWEKFLAMITMLANKFNLNLVNRLPRLQLLHSEFLSRNLYSRDPGPKICEQILENLDSDQPMPGLGIIEQSWLCAKLSNFSGNFYYPHDKFFKTPKQLKQYIK